ncbi:MAG: YhdP family protein [Methylococcales bacterium]|nr:YhdP family protein [Methylococcales bacterium]
MIHHLKRATRHLIFWSLIAIALSLTILRVLLLSIDDYKADLSTRMGELVGTPLSIGHLSANMRGYRPELVLQDIKISSTVADAPPAIQLKEIRLGINLLDLLLNRTVLSSSRISLVGAKLSVIRKVDGSIAIVGLKAGDEQPLWLMEGAQFEVLASEVTWLDQKSGAKAVKLEAVNLALINAGSQHKLNLITKLPKNYGDNLTIAIIFSGNAFAPDALDGQVFVEGKNLKLPILMELGLPLSATINSGTGTIKVWSDLQHSQLVSLQGEVSLQKLQLQLPEHEVFTAEDLKAKFKGQLQNKHWQFDVGQFLLTTKEIGGDKVWPDAVFSMAGLLNDVGQLQRISGFVKQVDLEEVSYLAQFFTPLSKQQLLSLRQTGVKGGLEQFAVYTDLDAKALAVSGEFKSVSLNPVAGVPGLVNVNGFIKGTDTAGFLRLASRDITVQAPDVFPDIIKISALSGQLNWLQSAADWQFSTDKLQINLQDFKAKAHLNLQLPKSNEPPFMDLQLAFNSTNIGELKRYFPTKVMKPADVVWFSKAFIGGQVTHGDLLYFAKLGAYPAKSVDGVFEIKVDVEDLGLDYAPDWPVITGINGSVDVEQRAMRCEITEGYSHDLKITQATVINPEMGKSKILTVKGSLEGEITNVFKFLKASPINSEVGFFVDAVTPQGFTPVSLDLTLPLAVDATPKVYGLAQLRDATLNVNALDLAISKINGDLEFTEHGVYSKTINAQALGKPIKVNINKQDHQQTFVNIAGNTQIDELKHQFSMPGWEMAEGALDYQLKLGLPYEGVSSKVYIHSDLVGVGLKLPGLLAKEKSQTKQLALTFDLGADKYLPIDLNYNEQLKAAVQLDLTAHRLYSGQIVLGAGEVQQGSEAGLNLTVNQTPFNFHDWIGLSAQKQDQTSMPLDVREIKLHTQQAQWKDTPLGAFDLTLKPKDGYWLGDLESAFANGKLSIPKDIKGADKLILDMSSVNLSALKDLQDKTVGASAKDPENSDTVIDSKATISPNDLPLLSMTSQKTWWRGVNLGQTTLESERIAEGMAFKQLQIKSAEQQLTMSGTWKVKEGVSQTQLEGHLDIPEAGKLLLDLDISKELTETQAAIDFSGKWAAAPYQFALKDVTGGIDINLKSGRLLSIEPGFGRVLGILAMAQWVKRIQLDFSDVYKEGLTFNTIKGHFDLLTGKAFTKDLVIDAVPAKISIAGEVDLVNETLDELVTVAPKSADAVPIAGTIVDKVTGLIGQSLTGKNQEGLFFGYQYFIKGPWNDSQVIPLHKNDGLVQKTWYGITDFPWKQENVEQK